MWSLGETVAGDSVCSAANAITLVPRTVPAVALPATFRKLLRFNTIHLPHSEVAVPAHDNLFSKNLPSRNESSELRLTRRKALLWYLRGEGGGHIDLQATGNGSAGPICSDGGEQRSCTAGTVGEGRESDCK